MALFLTPCPTSTFRKEPWYSKQFVQTGDNLVISQLGKTRLPLVCSWLLEGIIEDRNKGVKWVWC